MVVSEKGTVRGLLRPVLDEFAVGFQVMHGFSSATIVHDISEDDDGRRRSRNAETHRPDQDASAGLPSFPAKDKRKDPRYKWFRSNHGDRCWDSMPWTRTISTIASSERS